jgi:hypothetical protein
MLAWSVQVGAPWGNRAVLLAPAPSATPTPTATTVPTTAPIATPVPSTSGTGDQHVVGTMTGSLTTQYTTETPGPDGVAHIRGGVLTGTSTANDPRATGTVEFTFNLDTYTNVGSEWATATIRNDQGAWDGTCTGGSWDAGNTSLMSCWLLGSGAYKGYTFFFQQSGHDVSAEIEGIIYPGSPPKP